MFRMWGKIIKNNRLVQDMVIEDGSQTSRTAKVFHAVTQLCQEYDLSEPIWLDLNIRDFKRYSKTRFKNENFIESIDFDYLEISMIEED